MARRWWRAALAVVVLVGMVGALYTATRPDEPTEWWCAGAGIDPGPKAMNPEGALVAWVLSEGGDPSDWKRLSDGSYAPPDPEAAGYDSVDVSRDVHGVYSVSGVCQLSPSP